jgi:hypothetical protein
MSQRSVIKFFVIAILLYMFGMVLYFATVSPAASKSDSNDNDSSDGVDLRSASGKK